MNKIHLVVPMSGQGKRFQKAGYTMPKPLVPILDRPMIERLLEAFPKSWPTLFILSEAHRNTALPKLLKKLRPKGKQIFVEVHEKGPGYALSKAKGHIPEDEPTLVSYCDYGMIWDPVHFEQFVRGSKCDGCLVSYRGFHAHYLGPNPYAYSKMKGDRVVQVKEKGSFTDNRENEFASNGAYYFGRASLLFEALEAQERLDLTLNGESYTSLTMEALLQSKPKADVRVYEIPFFFQWGTPEDVQIYEYWERTLQAYLKLKKKKSSGEVSQFLMPMAGGGTRFRGIFKTPKPFLKIRGVPLFLKAVKSFPPAKDKKVFVTLREYEKQFKDLPLSKNEQRLFLKEIPPGQALTTEIGLQELSDKGDIIVTACDHEVVLDPAVWAKFRKLKGIDAAIFTVKGFPGVYRNPKAFAYVVSQGKGPFPLVTRVYVKEPPPGKMSEASLLVGSFWFRNREVALEGISELKAKDVRVNGELYLDSVFELLIAKGRKVCEIPLLGYLGYGTPDDLAESLYFLDAFEGRKLLSRGRYPGVQG